MPDNKMLDGIKKINGQDLRKARETVLKSIGEKRKEVYAENIHQKLPKEDSGFNFEKNKKENIPQSRKVDGISFGAQKKLKELIGAEEHKELENTKIRQPEAGPPMAEKHASQRLVRLWRKNTKTQKHESRPKKKKKKARVSFWQKLILRFGKHESTKTFIRRSSCLSGRRVSGGGQKHSASPQNTKTLGFASKHKNTKTRKHKNTKTSHVKAVLRFFAYFLLILIIYLILFYALFFMTLVNFNFDSKAVRRASEYLLVPAMVTKIGIVEYYDYKDAMGNFYYSNKDNLEINNLTEKKIKQELVKEILINNIAREYNIQITAEEQEQEFNRIISGKSEDEIKNIIGAYYHLGEERYIERVVRPKLLSEKTNQAVLYDQEINYFAFFRASKIKKALESGDDFYKIAEEQGDGLGFGKYYSFDEAISMFGDSSAIMSAGQTSEVIIFNNRYYIVYCFARRENSIGLRHVFIKAKSLDDYIQEEVSGMKVWSFVD